MAWAIFGPPWLVAGVGRGVKRVELVVRVLLGVLPMLVFRGLGMGQVWRLVVRIGWGQLVVGWCYALWGLRVLVGVRFAGWLLYLCCLYLGLTLGYHFSGLFIFVFFRCGWLRLGAQALSELLGVVR